MIFDTHLHTAFSADSDMRLTDALQKARELGIGLVTTEHLDLNAPNYADFDFDFDKYFAAYGSLRGDSLLLGIEIGMRPCCLPELRERLCKAPFDYVLGSIHIVDDIDICFDAYYRGKSKQAAYGAYFAAMAEAVRTYDFIDSLAHIDYIARYEKYPDAEITYAIFAESIDQVLLAAADRELALEINTRRFGDAKAVKALLPIYKRFSELGGKWVTIGSDAHRAENIGNYFAQALNFASECALQPVFFKERSRILMED